MKPEELLNPETLPEDLHWVVTRYRLQPDDPVFLLLAWHWNRMNACEDKIRSAIMELKAALDSRISHLADAAETVAGVNEALQGFQGILEDKPAEFGRKLDAELRQPVTHALRQLKALEQTLAPVARSFQAAQRRQLFATLLVGVALGVLSTVVLLLR